MVVTETQSQEIGFSNGALYLHTCPISAISFKGEYTHVYTPPAKEEDTFNNILSRNEQFPAKRQESMRKPVLDQLTGSAVKNVVKRHNESIAKAIINVKEDVNIAMTNVMRLTDQISRNRS